jgi:hypothetical protein
MGKKWPWGEYDKGTFSVFLGRITLQIWWPKLTINRKQISIFLPTCITWRCPKNWSWHWSIAIQVLGFGIGIVKDHVSNPKKGVRVYEV